jgi:DedD protein
MAAGTQTSESRDTDQLRDTEITLGTGKLLGIFFFLSILCGVFFTLGYMLGKSTSGGTQAEIVGTVPVSGNAAGKPAAGNKVQASAPAPADAASAPASSPDASSSKPSDASVGQTASSGKAPDTSNAAGDKNPGAGSYMVQVAAVSKQEDAEILKAALQKKQYPVFIATSAGDPLFHVQVGPFTDRKDAEAMKTKLAADGYGAIVK